MSFVAVSEACCVLVVSGFEWVSSHANVFLYFTVLCVGGHCGLINNIWCQAFAIEWTCILISTVAQVCLGGCIPIEDGVIVLLDDIVHIWHEEKKIYLDKIDAELKRVHNEKSL